MNPRRDGTARRIFPNRIMGSACSPFEYKSQRKKKELNRNIIKQWGELAATNSEQMKETAGSIK